MMNSEISKEADRFKEFTKKLVAVPKREIDEQLQLNKKKQEHESRKKK